MIGADSVEHSAQLPHLPANLCKVVVSVTSGQILGRRVIYRREE